MTTRSILRKPFPKFNSSSHKRQRARVQPFLCFTSSSELSYLPAKDQVRTKESVHSWKKKSQTLTLEKKTVQNTLNSLRTIYWVAYLISTRPGACSFPSCLCPTHTCSVRGDRPPIALKGSPLTTCTLTYHPVFLKDLKPHSLSPHLSLNLLQSEFVCTTPTKRLLLPGSWRVFMAKHGKQFSILPLLSLLVTLKRIKLKSCLYCNHWTYSRTPSIGLPLPGDDPRVYVFNSDLILIWRKNG